MPGTAAQGAAYRERVAGCLLGGALGDALGAPIEFLSLAAIRAQFGEAGLRDFAPAYGRLGAVTDDTQMTLFTADGLIRARLAAPGLTVGRARTALHRAYLRWLATQGRSAAGADVEMNGWLAGVSALHARRAPGNTCLAALAGARAGTPGEPLNDSKGCGGVMRVAPVGLLYADDPERAFRLGCEAAAITHGHPSGYLSAGLLAFLIAQLASGEPLRRAVETGRRRLAKESAHGEVSAALVAALAKADKPQRSEDIAELGQGWVAEEALAIALYCAVVGRDFEDAVLLAINHAGDSDSTGAITGNILGAVGGLAVLPERWLSRVELRREIERLASDLATIAKSDSSETMGATYRAAYPAG